MSRPRAFICAPSTDRCDFISAFLVDLKWHIDVAVGHDLTTANIAARDPDVILAEPAPSHPMLSDPVGALRARDDRIAHAPILTIGHRGVTEPDDHIDLDHAAALSTWTVAPNASLDRLIATFGRGEIARLSLSLRTLLIDALDSLSTGRSHALAHRVAGMAGTLGYRDLSAEWNVVSDGGDPAAARRLTRLAIYEITRNFA